MPHSRLAFQILLYLLVLAPLGIIKGHNTSLLFPPPANDNCSGAMSIAISGGGFDYGNFNSLVSDMTTAGKESGEFFEFANDYGHKKSVWFEFTVPTSRSIKIKLQIAPGSTLPDPKQSGVTLYAPSGCLPGAGDRLGSIISSGELERYCTTQGTYRIQVTAVDIVNASFIVNLTVSCPFDPIYPEVSIYDCPDKAFVFNSGAPLPQSSSQYTLPHIIECHSIENPTENACLPLADKADYTKSSWYVFTTGSIVDFLAFDFAVSAPEDKVGYRILEGNVKTQLFSSLPLIECGLANENAATRFIEFPCALNPNTTYSLELIFHKDFVYNNLNVRALQRGMTATGWPKPVQPPVIAANQLGVLPMTTTWADRFDCNSFIRDNFCPPANPASGLVTITSGATTKNYDLATWATFTLLTDANAHFSFDFVHADAKYYVRIFQRNLNAACPSPDPASGELYYEFAGRFGDIKCLPKGDYSIQVLASSNDNFPPAIVHQDSWSNGYLGTRFVLKFTIQALPSVGLFRLDAPGNADLINALNPMVHNVSYPGTPAVFVCENTVLPLFRKCANWPKAIYREFNIGDYDADGKVDEGLVCISGLRTDTVPPPMRYELFKGDANQLATSANTHAANQKISGLQEFLGICIDQIDHILTPVGIDNFCACVTQGTYTLAVYGDVDHVGKGDAPRFKLNSSKTIHDSPANAEIIPVGGVPGTYLSEPDVFTCIDNLGTTPPCGSRKKVVFREFFLSEQAVVTIKEVGQASPTMSLYNGRATDLLNFPDEVLTCFSSFVFYNPCKPLEPGWYTIVSYGDGPNFFTKIWNELGDQGDVGKTTVISIQLDVPILPKFNRPEKAYQAGITDWMDPPPGDPNVLTGKIYAFEKETFCDPDTPFIADHIAPCAAGFNRIAFFVFEITKPSFVQIRNVNFTFATEVFPFDVNAQPDDLLNVPPVYPCITTDPYTRQICDLPPGKYTLAIFAKDIHYGTTVTPSIYVDEAGLSRFDHAWDAYDFDLVPTTNTFVDGKLLDTHPFLTGQPPSRDVFYCTTGAHINDPIDTKCGTQLNPNVYDEPFGIPKPLFLQDNPPNPALQPWRTLWYTFKLSGSGTCTVHTDAWNGLNYRPLVALYESDLDGTIPWSTLQASLNSTGDTIIPGFKLMKELVSTTCDAEMGDIVFNKSGCIRDQVRYYVVVSFDGYEINGFPPNLPNQVVSLSIKYNGKPTFGAPYDEASAANVINGLIESTPPYTPVSLVPGNTFTSTDFSLLCYTKNVTDPPGCAPTATGKSAWFKFVVGAPGQLLLALEKIGIPNGWLTTDENISIWHDNGSGPPFTQEFPLNHYTSGHPWLGACIDPGTYYLLIRQCSALIDSLQPYRIVLNLDNSPGDFCNTAIPIAVNDFNPASANVIINCHTIGTDIGEMLPVGNACFSIPKQKTSWFKVSVNAGPMVDLKFQLGENFTTTAVDLSDVNYRILSGTCGSMTPIACSEGNINLTLNCLGQGDYYVQVSMPEKTNPDENSLDVEGTLSLTVIATPSNPQNCTDPFDPNEITANFSFQSDCESVTFFNLSTGGSDITYLWEFPDGTTTEANPVWTPPPGSSTYSITLTVTNIVLNTSTSITLMVTVNDLFEAYVPMADQILCNGEAGILNATYSSATYLWDDNSKNSTRVIQDGGLYWVSVTVDGCTFIDSVQVEEIQATNTISKTLCAGESFMLHGELFDQSNPNGTITIPNAHPSGCDSLLNVQLSFLAPISFQFDKSICEGESYLFANTLLTQTGIYQDTLVSANGCDSMITLHLAVTPRQTFNRALSDCIGNTVLLMPVVVGELYDWSTGSHADSILVNTTGTYVVSITDAANCMISEETFVVSFGVLAAPAVVVPSPGCVGTDVLISASGSSGNYFWFDDFSGGQLLGSGSTFVIPSLQLDTTIYLQAFQVGLDTCWSERIPVQIKVIPENVEVIEIDTVICEGSVVILPWGEMVQPQTAASYTHSWQSAVTGCDSLQLTVYVNLLDKQSIFLPSLLTLHLGDSVQLEPVIDFLPDSLIWLPPDGLSCITCPEPWAQPALSTDYLLSVWSAEGCLVTAPIRIEVKRNIRIYIPNVFSPNADGTNDFFTAIGGREVFMVRRLSVYDRWGEALWEARDFLPDGSGGWDGTFHNKPMPSGVFAWTCELELIDGSTEQLKGGLTLVR